MGLADEIRAAAKNAFTKATDVSWDYSHLPMGVLPADYALGGGWAEGRLGEVFGPYSAGKTLFLYMLLIANQKRGGVSALMEAEGAFDPKFFTSLGGNADTLLIYPDPEAAVDAKERNPTYLEDYFEVMESTLKAALGSKSEESLVIGFDSLAAAVPKAVQTAKKMDMKYHMAKAQALSDLCPILKDLAHRANAVILATNQERKNPDPYATEPTTTGGVSWPYYSSQRLSLDKSSKIRVEKIGDVGYWIRGQVIKNKTNPALRRFRLPIYVRDDILHPVYETPITMGIHRDEALWTFYAGHKGGQSEEVFYSAPDGKPVVISAGGGGWYELHEVVGTRRFQRADWPGVVTEFPALLDLPFKVGKSEPMKTEAKAKKGKAKK